MMLSDKSTTDTRIESILLPFSYTAVFIQFESAVWKNEFWYSGLEIK